MMDFYFLWLSGPKPPEKPKAYLGLFATQSGKEMEVKVLPRRLRKPPFPFPSKDPQPQSCDANTERVRRGEGDKLLLTLPIHKEPSPPSKFFIPLTLLPSQLPRLLPGKAGVRVRHGAQHHRDEQCLRLIHNGSPHTQGEHSTALRGR